MFPKITHEIINYLICELKKNDTQEQIKVYLIDPLICYMLDRLYPYIFITCTVFILILFISISILLLIIRTYK